MESARGPGFPAPSVSKKNNKSQKEETDRQEKQRHHLP